MKSIIAIPEKELPVTMLIWIKDLDRVFMDGQKLVEDLDLSRSGHSFTIKFRSNPTMIEKYGFKKIFSSFFDKFPFTTYKLQSGKFNTSAGSYSFNLKLKNEID